MLQDIGSVDNVSQFVEQVKKREKKLMGFGHRIYKNYDPRAKIIQKLAHQVRINNLLERSQWDFFVDMTNFVAKYVRLFFLNGLFLFPIFVVHS